MIDKNGKWSCTNCNEDIDNSFEGCWNCGFNRVSQRFGAFVHADDYSPEDLETSNQFRIRQLLLVTTAIALVFGGIANQNSLIFFPAVIYLTLQVFCWLLPFVICKFQKKASEMKR